METRAPTTIVTTAPVVVYMILCPLVRHVLSVTSFPSTVVTRRRLQVFVLDPGLPARKTRVGIYRWNAQPRVIRVKNLLSVTPLPAVL